MDQHGGLGDLEECCPQSFAQVFGILEGGHDHAGLPQLVGGVGVGAGRAQQVVLCGELPGLLVSAGEHAAGVEGLDGVHQVYDVEEVVDLPVPGAHAVERVRDADEGALVAQACDSLDGG